MVATLFVGGLVKLGARSFASITGLLLKHAQQRGVKREVTANGGHLHIVEGLILNDAELEVLMPELEALSQHPEWAAGRIRAKKAAA